MLAKLTTRLRLRRSTLTGAVGLAVLAAGLPAVAVRDTESDLTRFYRQKVVWTKCENKSMPKDLQCGKVTVPLDYAKPKSGTLELALARYRATGKSRGSVVLNFGGPGGPGVPQLAFGGDDFMELTDGYDVVSFDPRGVGRSSPVSCGDGSDEASEAMDTDTDLTDDPRAVLKQLKQAATQCAKHSGPVLPHIGTVNASRDLDVIRQALGDKKLNYLGFSYGTRLGAVYAAQFPDKVGRLVLDGVDTLTEPLTEQAIVGAEGQQTALDAFVAWCAEDDVACPLGTDSRTAREHVVSLVESLDEDPVPTDFGDSFTGQDLVASLSQALYSRDMWPTLERAIASLVEDGDARGLLALTGGGMARNDDGGLADEEDVPFDNLPAALMAINCADDPDRPTADWITRNLDRLRTEYEEASPSSASTASRRCSCVTAAPRAPTTSARRCGTSTPRRCSSSAPAATRRRRTAGPRRRRSGWAPRPWCSTTGARATPGTPPPSACTRRSTTSCSTARCPRAAAPAARMTTTTEVRVRA